MFFKHYKSSVFQALKKTNIFLSRLLGVMRLLVLEIHMICLSLNILLCMYVGVLISGGNPSSTRGKVELYNLLTKTSCELPDLPEDRYYHTSEDGVICGGGDTTAAVTTSCTEISSGSWSSDAFKSIRPRWYHLSWTFNQGELILLGGGANHETMRTTDIVTTNGTVVPGFDLQFFV